MSDYLNYPSISVIVPSFNQGQFIEETLLSIIGQQYPNLEILVIDGGSTDNTVEILEKYSSQIAYWHSKKDQGQADAINQGISLSSGDVICWLNSDDMFMPGALLDVGSRFRERTDESYLIYGATVIIKESDEIISSDAQIPGSFDAFKLTYTSYMSQPSTFWTRKLVQSVGKLEIKYNYVLDWEWFIRASKVTEFEYVPKFYSIYRYHPSHKTSNGGVQRRKEIVEVVENYSSDYWKTIYHKVDKKYEEIDKILSLFVKAKVRGVSLALLILFPKITSIVKEKKDFITAVNMFK